MEVWKALDLKEGDIVSFVGGGGKTTTIFKLAKELKALNKRVLLTTTTAIYEPEEESYDYYFLGAIDDFLPAAGTITILGHRVKAGKLLGPSPAIIDGIAKKQLFDFILIEADGSKRKPIKAYAYYEPVIPSCSTRTIGLIGLDCLGRQIKDIVHRPEKFAEIIGAHLDDVVDENMVVKLILDNKGLFKSSRGRRVLLLNKAREKNLIGQGIKIIKKIYQEGFKGIALVGDVMSNKFYK